MNSHCTSFKGCTGHSSLVKCISLTGRECKCSVLHTIFCIVFPGLCRLVRMGQLIYSCRVWELAMLLFTQLLKTCWICINAIFSWSIVIHLAFHWAEATVHHSAWPQACHWHTGQVSSWWNIKPTAPLAPLPPSVTNMQLELNPFIIHSIHYYERKIKSTELRVTNTFWSKSLTCCIYCISINTYIMQT